MSIVPADRPIAIFYEHPDWFTPLFAELYRRGTPYVKLHADEHVFDSAGQPVYSAGYAVMRATEAQAREEVARITDVRQSARGYANCQDWIGNTQLEQR